MLAEAAAKDKEEDVLYGPQRRGDKLLLSGGTRQSSGLPVAAQEIAERESSSPGSCNLPLSCGRISPVLWGTAENEMPKRKDLLFQQSSEQGQR